MKIRRIQIVIVYTLLLFVSPGLYAADVIEEAWSVISDPLKLGEGSENILDAAREARDAITALDELRAKTDENIKSYLRDFDRKILQIEKSSMNVVTHAVTELKTLEKLVINDLGEIIRKTECAAINVADDALSTSLRDVLPSFLEGDKRVIELPFGEQQAWIFFKKPITIEIDLSKSPEPDAIFYTIEREVLANLDLANDDSSAQKIVGVYGNLAKLAKRTQCLYREQHYGNRFARKYAKYNAMVYAWEKSVRYGE